MLKALKWKCFICYKTESRAVNLQNEHHHKAETS